MSVSFLSICVIFFFMLMILSICMFVMGLVALYKLKFYFFEIELLSLQSSKLVMTFLMDWISFLFISLVMFISSLVIYYSLEYMKTDKYLHRFVWLVMLFVLSMLFLIISPNLISILLGWDGLGLVSYCLVIYYQNVKSYNAGMLTALSNRVGDVMILLSIAWMLNFGSWNYIFYLEIMKSSGVMQFIGGLVIIAAITKSAQIPFSMWLPAAMAAPTPVSALVHSSTLVTAGVYLLIRFNILIHETEMIKILFLLGGLTTVMAGIGANFEFDLKKIIALSTLSQLGLMMMILSMGAISLTFFHLLTHALFKALLFMCAGAIIHSMGNFQDIRYMGSLILQMPFTSVSLNLANMALCGVPFLAGFYSKDLILEMSSFMNLNFLCYFIYFFSTGLTVSYSVRLSYYLFFIFYNSWVFFNFEDSFTSMTLGMIGLLSVSVVGGASLAWLVLPCPCFIFLPFFMKVMTLMVCLIGGVAGAMCSLMGIFYESKSLILSQIVSFWGSMWFLPFIMTSFLIFFTFSVSMKFFEVVDLGIFENLNKKNYMKMMKIAGGFQNLLNNNVKKFLSLVNLLNLIIFMVIFF